jgi:uncharacterized protein (TIGR00730 family)
LGRLLAREKIGLVFGGGRVGLMGVIADAVLEAGGQVIGVIPDSLVKKEVAHSRVNDMRVVSSMHERKALMEQLSDGFIAMPGGFGTFDEFCEIVTWVQLGIHDKPCGVLNTAGYFDQFLSFADYSVKQGFVQPELRARIHASDDPEKLLAAFRAQKPFSTTKWHKSPQP